MPKGFGRGHVTLLYFEIFYILGTSEARNFNFA